MSWFSFYEPHCPLSFATLSFAAHLRGMPTKHSSKAEYSFIFSSFISTTAPSKFFPCFCCGLALISAPVPRPRQYGNPRLLFSSFSASQVDPLYCRFIQADPNPEPLLTNAHAFLKNSLHATKNFEII